MEYAISKLSANFKLVKLLKRVLKNATSFSDPRTLKDTVLFSCLSVIRRLFWVFIAVLLEVSQSYLRWSGVVSNFLKNVLSH